MGLGRGVALGLGVGLGRGVALGLGQMSEPGFTVSKTCSSLGHTGLLKARRTHSLPPPPGRGTADQACGEWPPAGKTRVGPSSWNAALSLALNWLEKATTWFGSEVGLGWGHG